VVYQVSEVAELMVSPDRRVGGRGLYSASKAASSSCVVSRAPIWADSALVQVMGAITRRLPGRSSSRMLTPARSPESVTCPRCLVMVCSGLG
jgi:hypothetical protein